VQVTNSATLNWATKEQLFLDSPTFVVTYFEQFDCGYDKKVENALKSLLAFVASDPAIKHRSWAAYIFATVLTECGPNFVPIEERGKLPYFDRYDKPPLSTQLGNKLPGDGFMYRGRGYCQITGRGHYERFGKRLSLNLIDSPDLALRPDISYRIMSDGMVHGLFTGVSLSNYLTEAKKDYSNARRIINGMDKAAKIANDAMKFEICLKESERQIHGQGDPQIVFPR
jgi:putative chitinase